jgi:hypothetical protein
MTTRTAAVSVSRTYDNEWLREYFDLDCGPGYMPRWHSDDTPDPMPYEIKLDMISFPECGPEIKLARTACISLVKGRKHVLRAATIWELLALLRNDELSFDDMIRENGNRPIVLWGSSATLLDVPCTPVLFYAEVPKIVLVPQSDTFPLGSYAHLVVVE